MDTIILAGVLIFLFLMFIYGYQKGFIVIVLSLVTSILALVLAVALAEPFENYIKNNTKIYDKVNKQMEEYVEKYIRKEMDLASDEIQKDSINELKLPTSIREKLIKNNTDDVKVSMGVDTFSEYVSRTLTDILIESIAIIVLFVVIKIILRIVVSLVNLISRLPVLRTVNRTFGGAAGLVEGMLIIWIAAIVVTAFSGTGLGGDILEAISSNKILNYIYNNNILLNFMESM